MLLSDLPQAHTLHGQLARYDLQPPDAANIAGINYRDKAPHLDIWKEWFAAEGAAVITEAIRKWLVEKRAAIKTQLGALDAQIAADLEKIDAPAEEPIIP